MPEQYSEHETDDEQSVLDKRFKAYYGPALPEQPLPASSWDRLSSQLTPRRTTRRWLRPKWRFAQRRGNAALPFDIQERLTHVTYLANMPRITPSVRSTFTSYVDVPFVSVSLFSKRAIRLTLPTQGGLSLSQAELDVLLASGFARYKLMRQATYIISRLLLFTLLLLPLVATVLISLAWRNVPVPVALSLLASLCILSTICFWLLGIQGRQTVQQADAFVVQWIGREQTCRGLHALAARSRASERKRWGEPSLDERIRTICHTPIIVEDERFTLVR